MSLTKTSTPWEVALSKAKLGRKPIRNGTVLLLGNVGSGKSTLISNLQKIAQQATDETISNAHFTDTGSFSLLDCAYIPMRAPKKVDLPYHIETCEFHLLQDPTKKEFLNSVFARRWRMHGLSTFMIIISISLADMLTAYEQAEMWLNFVTDYIPSLIESISTNQVNEDGPADDTLLTEWARIKEAATSSENDTDSIIRMGIPIAVVGCKADLLPSSRSTTETAKLYSETFFLCHLRNLCRKYEAHLIFSETSSESSVGAANLHHWISAMCFGQPLSLEINLKPAAALYVPPESNKKEDLQELAVEGGGDLDTPLQAILERSHTANEKSARMLQSALPSEVAEAFDDFLARMAEKYPQTVKSQDEIAAAGGRESRGSMSTPQQMRHSVSVRGVATEGGHRRSEDHTQKRGEMTEPPPRPQRDGSVEGRAKRGSEVRRSDAGTPDVRSSQRVAGTRTPGVSASKPSRSRGEGESSERRTPGTGKSDNSSLRAFLLEGLRKGSRGEGSDARGESGARGE